MQLRVQSCFASNNRIINQNLRLFFCKLVLLSTLKKTFTNDKLK